MIEFINKDTDERLKDNSKAKYTIPKKFYFEDSRELFINP